MPIVSSLFVYPIKSCAGVSVTELRYAGGAVQGDRQYMVIDDEGRGLTQRTCPRLALLRPSPLPDGTMAVACTGMDAFHLTSPTERRLSVRVWDYVGEGLDLGDTAARWFTEALERKCRLVMFPPDVRRDVSPKHTQLISNAQFTDGYPLLLCTVESLTELNRRLATPVPMNRFRPNVVLRDCAPFAEDDWRVVHFPRLSMDIVKPCERCVIVTIDQTTLTRSKEPLSTLSTFRKRGAGVCFGQNCVPHDSGAIAVGEKAEVEMHRRLFSASEATTGSVPA